MTATPAVCVAPKAERSYGNLRQRARKIVPSKMER
jgi:hypothetical protein